MRKRTLGGGGVERRSDREKDGGGLNYFVALLSHCTGHTHVQFSWTPPGEKRTRSLLNE